MAVGVYKRPYYLSQRDSTCRIFLDFVFAIVGREPFLSVLNDVCRPSEYCFS